MDTMLFDREIISVLDVKDVMQSKELKKKVFGTNEERLDLGLVVDRGRTNNKGEKNKSRSKSRKRIGGRCYHCDEQ